MIHFSCASASCHVASNKGLGDVAAGGAALQGTGERALQHIGRPLGDSKGCREERAVGDPVHQLRHPAVTGGDRDRRYSGLRRTVHAEERQGTTVLPAVVSRGLKDLTMFSRRS